MNYPEINESNIFSVSEVSLHLRQVIETQIEALYVVGEISNFVRHGSGHIYFNLKDENAVIRCAFFRTQNYILEFDPQNGDQVVCFGKITVYEKSGQYQILVQNMFPYGKGALQNKFELLKNKLKSEGLFSTEHKQQIPKLPTAIGIITSPTGAALQDILKIMHRRYPCKVYVYPSLMQGQSAPQQIIKGIKYFNQNPIVDFIIIARGGGSQEDLFCFNDEDLARVIFDSKLPIVSAIGHEIDFTIADFVADLRASTPSAAAQLTTPDQMDLMKILSEYLNKLNLQISHKISMLRSIVNFHQISMIQNSPEKLWFSMQQRFDEVTTGLAKFVDIITKTQMTLNHKHEILNNALINNIRRIMIINSHQYELINTKFGFLMQRNFESIRHKLQLVDAIFEESSPTRTMKRGYSIIRKNKRTINSIDMLNPADNIEVIVSDGSAMAEVKSVKDKIDEE